MTKLSPSLPGGNHNGLGALNDKLVRNPQALSLVVAVVDCKSITTDNDTGDITPTARIRRIEPIAPEDYEAGQQLVRRAFEYRTGQEVLPLDLEDELKALGQELDPLTCEVIDSDSDDEE